jgi:hypothetical protein
MIETCEEKKGDDNSLEKINKLVKDMDLKSILSQAPGYTGGTLTKCCHFFHADCL